MKSKSGRHSDGRHFPLHHSGARIAVIRPHGKHVRLCIPFDKVTFLIPDKAADLLRGGQYIGPYRFSTSDVIRIHYANFLQYGSAGVWQRKIESFAELALFHGESISEHLACQLYEDHENLMQAMMNLHRAVCSRLQKLNKATRH